MKQRQTKTHALRKMVCGNRLWSIGYVQVQKQVYGSVLDRRKIEKEIGRRKRRTKENLPWENGKLCKICQRNAFSWCFRT